MVRFRGDGTFTVVQFADIHWRNGDELDRRSAALMGEILDAEQPDLVIFDGDVLYGAGCKDADQAWREAVAPAVERGLAWAAVFGNHDDEGDRSRAELMALQRTLPGCLSQPGPATLSGVGNYVIPIFSATRDEVAAYLYCLDSHAYARNEVGGYGWIERDQIAWYLETARDLRARHGKTLPALAFFHIPLPEFNEVWDLHPCRGVKGEPICCPLLNSGFFAALYEGGDVMGVFVGHDHLNDFMGDLHGIRLAFGRATGYGGYGRDDFPRGARVIRLSEGVYDFESWLRLAGGDVVLQQALHEPEVRRGICIL